jgi:alkaline phosphatase
MNRRDFFQKTSLGFLGAGLWQDNLLTPAELDAWKGKKPTNVIFMVSDGMSTGTLNMASLLRRRMEGTQSHWLQLYEQGMVSRGLMDMASASSMITDSAAASSSWGGGVRVKNGALNTNADGSPNKPIWQKFKQAGKAVGCVTTVPITHATPAGFCVVNKTRGDQSEIALQYLDLRFDVMMGGGTNFFSADLRKDKQDVFGQYAAKGYRVAKNRSEMAALAHSLDKPVLGVFHEDGLPFSLDRKSSKELETATPTLAEMTQKAIGILSQNKKGFALQIEGGKVDWAAHSNDAGGILYDQLAFDDAIRVVVDFARKDGNTLVVVTTDHGNANPGLFYGEKADANFDKIQSFKQTNEWILKGITKNTTLAQIVERHEAATGIAITTDEAKSLYAYYTEQEEGGVYNAYKLPFRTLGKIQTNYTSVGWAGVDHSADFVELAMHGPGSELMKPFMKNTDMHNFLLNVCQINDLVKG